jgi:hypothetical protein
MSVDLQIKNYNHRELRQLFKLDQDVRLRDKKQAMKKMMATIKAQCVREIYTFYYKAYIILAVIDSISDAVQEDKELDKYIDKIHQIQRFENYEIEDIVDKIYVAPGKKGGVIFQDVRPIVQPNIQTNTVINSFPN